MRVFAEARGHGSSICTTLLCAIASPADAVIVSLCFTSSAHAPRTSIGRNPAHGVRGIVWCGDLLAGIGLLRFRVDDMPVVPDDACSLDEASLHVAVNLQLPEQEELRLVAGR